MIIGVLILAIILVPLLTVLNGVAEASANGGAGVFLVLLIVGAACVVYFVSLPSARDTAIASCNSFQKYTNMDKNRYNRFCECQVDLYRAGGGGANNLAGREFLNWEGNGCWGAFKPEGLKIFKRAQTAD